MYPFIWGKMIYSGLRISSFLKPIKYLKPLSISSNLLDINQILNGGRRRTKKLLPQKAIMPTCRVTSIPWNAFDVYFFFSFFYARMVGFAFCGYSLKRFRSCFYIGSLYLDLCKRIGNTFCWSPCISKLFFEVFALQSNFRTFVIYLIK